MSKHYCSTFLLAAAKALYLFFPKSFIPCPMAFFWANSFRETEDQLWRLETDNHRHQPCNALGHLGFSLAGGGGYRLPQAGGGGDFPLCNAGGMYG